MSYRPLARISLQAPALFALARIRATAKTSSSTGVHRARSFLREDESTKTHTYAAGNKGESSSLASSAVSRAESSRLGRLLPRSGGDAASRGPNLERTASSTSSDVRSNCRAKLLEATGREGERNRPQSARRPFREVVRDLCVNQPVSRVPLTFTAQTRPC